MVSSIFSGGRLFFKFLVALGLVAALGRSLVVCRRLIAAASLLAEHRFQGTWASVAAAHGV